MTELDVSCPPPEYFIHLGDVTTLKMWPRGSVVVPNNAVPSGERFFFRFNFERGLLLYALVAKLRPTHILEFGTGGGYSTLCMAKALSDLGVDGSIFTIDIIPPDKKRPWWQKRPGKDPEERCLSLQEVWQENFDKELLSRITCLTGTSVAVMNRCRKSKFLPKIDFFYIDGAHNYETVKHDYFSSITVAAEQFTILFDDYGPAYDWITLLDEERDRLPSVEVMRTWKTKFKPYFEVFGREVSPAPEEVHHLAQQMALAANLDRAVFETADQRRRINAYLKYMRRKHRVDFTSAMRSKIRRLLQILRLKN